MVFSHEGVRVSVLREELLNDPLERGYASMSDAEVAESLNRLDRVVPALVPSADVHIWALYQNTPEDGPFEGAPLVSVLEAARMDRTNQLFGLAVILLRAVDQKEKPWDMQMPANLALMVGAVASGLLSEDQVNELKAKGFQAVSRAHELGFGHVDHPAVAEARNG